MSSLFTTSRGVLKTRLFSPLHALETSPKKLAVLTHPWSPLGGNMHDPVLDALRPCFLSRGFHVLIYNALPSFTGISEAQDLQELVQGTLINLGYVKSVVLLGYSHGSLITSKHPLLPPPTKTYHILLSYPMSVRGLITFFHGATFESALQSVVQDPESSILVLYGDHDQFTSLQRYERWVADLKDKAKGHLTTALVPGADHFWRGRAGEEMGNVVSTWLDDIVSG